MRSGAPADQGEEVVSDCHVPREELPVVTRRLRLALIGALASTAALSGAASAQASLVKLGPCDNATLSQPFAPWLDFDNYKLAPGGDGSLTGWSLQGGAQQVSGGEPWNVSGSATNSLSLPSGASATSPVTCVNAAYPTFRFFNVAGSPGSSAAVSVLYNGISIPVGLLTPDTSWSPTLPLTTLSAIWGALNGGSANIQLQFTGVTGTVQIDDVYVDPWGRH
jgi:hypothetical protein